MYTLIKHKETIKKRKKLNPDQFVQPGPDWIIQPVLMGWAPVPAGIWIDSGLVPYFG